MGMREKLIELVATAPGHANYEIYSIADIVDDLIVNGVTIPVRCKDCKHGIWDEDEGLYRCVYDAEYDEKYGEYFGFAEYNDGEHFCSYGERRTDV
jgi:hypothetical protein